MDWGLGNPNKTAALIGCLMAASWLLIRIRRGGFAFALTAFALLGACLIQTYSRGGVVAAIAGQSVVLAWRARPWPKGRALATMAVVLALMGYASWDGVGATRRFAQSPTADRSIGNRLAIWRAAPRMMVDAPSGWGWGRAGWAYTQWYQDPSTRYEYRTLVNSHLTTLAEANWLGRVAYAAAVLAILTLCWPIRGGSSVPLAIWVVFLSGAAFSSIMESPFLWILPVAALTHSVWIRLRTHTWPSKAIWGAIFGSAILINITLALVGLAMSPQAIIRGSPTSVHVGTTGPLFWLPDPDPRVLGTHYGMEIRRLAQGGQRWDVCNILKKKQLPIRDATIVLSGKPSDGTLSTVKDLQTNRLVWLNPSDIATFEQNISGRKGSVHAIYGQRRSDSGFRGAVQSARALGVEPVVVRGAALYLRQWSSLVGESEKR